MTPAVEHAWVAVMQSFATIALILATFGFILGIVKPADAPKYVGAIVGFVIALILIPVALANLWSTIPLWRRFGLAVVGIVVWQLRGWRRQSRNKKGD